MLKILVPTDFSANSRAGMRFAIQWSMQQKIELIFFHVFRVIALPVGKDYRKYIETEEADAVNKMQHFVSALYKSMHHKPGKYSCVVKQGISPDLVIMEYCREHADIDYICIATRGAGKLNKLFGTNTGNLITKSKVPVIAVPKSYRKKSVKHILYAADFQDYSRELKRVEDFARPLKANIEVLHLTWPYEVMPDRKILEKPVGKKFPYGEDVKIRRTGFARSFFKDLQNMIYKSKPSLIIMFTDQDRNLIEKILFPSMAEQLSFTTKIPLLAFRKLQSGAGSKPVPESTTLV